MIQKPASIGVSLGLLRLQNEFVTRFNGTIEDFTDRELEIIELIALGLNSYEIGEKLYISKHTVDTHRKNIYRKGGFSGIRDVIIFSLIFQQI